MNAGGAYLVLLVAAALEAGGDALVRWDCNRKAPGCGSAFSPPARPSCSPMA